MNQCVKLVYLCRTFFVGVVQINKIVHVDIPATSTPQTDTLCAVEIDVSHFIFSLEKRILDVSIILETYHLNRFSENISKSFNSSTSLHNGLFYLRYYTAKCRFKYFVIFFGLIDLVE